MKRVLAILLALIVIALSGCSLKVERDVFYLPQGTVEGVELQREYLSEDGKVYYKSKTVTEKEDIETVCEMFRKLPVRRASSKEPHPMTEFSLIVLIKGKRECHLVLTEEMAFYNQEAYNYSNKDTFSDFVALYEKLDYEEKDTEPDRF